MKGEIFQILIDIFCIIVYIFVFTIIYFFWDITFNRPIIIFLFFRIFSDTFQWRYWYRNSNSGIGIGLGTKH